MQKGFTLIEIIIYLAIITTILIASLNFAWTIINDQTKQENLSEVNNAGRFILDKITYNTKRSNAIEAGSIYDANPGKLILSYIANPQMIIDTYDKQITLGGTDLTITKLRLTRGANLAVDLTGDKINVSNFVITDSSNASAVTINIELTLSAINPSETKSYEAQNSWTTSITVRKRQ